ncbi:MAG TPA: hypothetical protein VJ283_06430, partial [Trebonia sp.]|nr:hypothetical protein [Trebonia sp.]
MQARVTGSRRIAGWRPARSLSGRLIAGLVVLLALGCATVGVVTYFAIQRALSNELDNQLQAATGVANTCLDHLFSPGSNDDNGTNNAGQPGQPGQGSGSALSTMYCEGLGNGTFVASLHDGQWGAMVVPSQVTLSAADKATLSAISPSPIAGPPPPCLTRDLPSAGGTYELTVARDPHGTYITGLSLNGVNDLLKDVALAEIGVFGGALVLAGVLGTVWVRLSLRPLRRVAVTASRVAELPLESGEVAMP